MILNNKRTFKRVSGKYRIQSGSSSYAYYSDNYGKSWHNTTYDSSNWRCCAVSQSGQYMAYASYSTSSLWYSSNYGNSWTNVTPRGVSYKMAISDNGDIYMVAPGSSGFIHKYSISSNTSSILKSPGNFVNIACSANGSYVVAIIYAGYIYKSSNSGSSWTEVASSKYWRGVTCSSDGRYMYAISRDGGIYYSTNYGSTWYSGGFISWQMECVTCSTTGRVAYASAYNSNYLVRTFDYGNTWNSISTYSYGLDSNFDSMSCSEDGRIVLGLRSGTLYTSSNYGQTWISKSGWGTSDIAINK